MNEGIEKVQKETVRVQLEVVKQIIVLSTNGLGLVAALAWNNVIQETVNSYVKPYLPKGSGLISLLLYALIVTFLVVTLTLQLTRFKERLEKELTK